MEKYFFFDIDGTLIECNKNIYEIQPNTQKALMELQAKGDKVFLATGRCKCFIVDGVMSYPFDGYVTCNGAYVEYHDQVVYKKVISKEALKKTHDFCVQHHLSYYFENSEKIYVLNKENERHIEFKTNWGMKDEIIKDDFDIDHIEVYIGMIILNDEDQVDDMIKELFPYFDVQRHLCGLSFDLTLKGESKAKGIRELIKSLNGNMKQTIAFGDGRNDIEMLSEVHLGIAMGNAALETKKAAKYITLNVEDDGIVSALKKFSFID